MAAVCVGGVDHASAAEQPPAPRATVDHPAAAFGMRFGREVIAGAVAPCGAADHRGFVGERADAVVLPHPPDPGRPVGQALGEQLLRAIEGEIQRLHPPERIGDHHLGVAGPVDARLGRQLEGADRDLAVVLAQTVHIQLHVGGHHRLAEEGRRGGQHAVGLQAIVAPDLHTGHADRPAPVDKAAVEVTHGQRHGRFREIQAPCRIQTHAFAPPLPIGGVLVRAQQRAGFQYAVAQPEQTQFGGQGQVAAALVVAAVKVVVEQHAG